VAGAAAAPLLHHEARDRARAVAAGADLGAVGVVDAHEDVGALRGLEAQQLVAADAVAAIGDAADLGGRERQLAAPSIEDHEVVAEALHLMEVELVHGAANMAIGAAGATGKWR